MPSPISIASRLRAILLLVLLVWLGVGSAWATTPRAAVVRPGSPTITHHAQPAQADLLHQEASAPPHLGLFRSVPPDLALLPTIGFSGAVRSWNITPGAAAEPSASAVSPLLRAWLRTSVSPNAPKAYSTREFDRSPAPRVQLPGPLFFLLY
ncbi:hypothetical protein [Hymenobacter cellulosilyticus]|uniref:Uncharacterized protein n=1 Tax=Hymenobacter cellulosilyticus TaxID=2932248 RepID=A0A8T9QG67_9BACT|nr:hypothetical protein [Hymenobacter cellulosilyticus]UOQ74559.1 hypothetical protein MUN79_12200 [Hymenobacter cellulosilyticus]